MISFSFCFVVFIGYLQEERKQQQEEERHKQEEARRVKEEERKRKLRERLESIDGSSDSDESFSMSTHMK